MTLDHTVYVNDCTRVGPDQAALDREGDAVDGWLEAPTHSGLIMTFMYQALAVHTHTPLGTIAVPGFEQWTET